MSVTAKPKSYVFQCAGCKGLAQSSRSDAITCSPACRVKANRTGEAKRLRDIAARAEVYKPGTLDPDPAQVVQAKALRLLVPELWDKCLDGDMLPSQAMPEAVKAFLEQLRDEVER